MFNKLLEPGHDYILTKFPVFAKLSTKIQTMVGRLQRATKAIVKLTYVTPKLKKKTISPSGYPRPGSPRGIADLLLDQAKKPGFKWMEEDLEHTVSFMLAIFWAAHLSTKSLLLGAMLCLVNYPNIAKKIQKEIDDVLDDRPPTVEDKADMPYTSATILELLRLITLVPLSGLRFIRGDISFEGMTIPKGTLIMASQWFIHHDKRVWQDPWTPKPERFLSNTEQLLPPEDPVRKNIIPFGAGIRSCLGESFAQNRVFLIMTSILQKFDLHPPANEELRPADFTTNLDSAKGFVRQIPQFKCRLQRRRK